MKQLNLLDILPYIPPLQNVSLSKGVVNCQIKILFTTSKREKPDFKISGQVYFWNLELFYRQKEKPLLKNGSGSLFIQNIDLFEKKIQLNSLNLVAGQIYYPLLPPLKKNPFQIKINKIQTRSIDINLYFPLQDHSYLFTKSNILLKNYENQNPQFFYEVAANYYAGQVQLTGFFKPKDIRIDLLQINNFNLTQSNFFKSYPPYLKNLIVSEIKGKGTFKNNKDFTFMGMVDFSDLRLQFKNNQFVCDQLKLSILEYQLPGQKLTLDQIVCLNGHYQFKNQIMINNIQIIVQNENQPFNLTFQPDFELKQPIQLKNIQANYSDPAKSFSIKAEKINLDPQINITKDNILMKGQANLADCLIYNQYASLFQIDQASFDIERITFNPLQISILSITGNQLFIPIERRADKKIYFLTMFSPQNQLSGQPFSFLSIDSLKLTDSQLTFIDHFIQHNYTTTLDDLQLVVKNYPSFVYPTGTIELTGNINQKSPFQLEGNIGKRETKGMIKIEDLYLQPFSPYSQFFLKHQVLNGRMELELPFTIAQNELDLLFKMKMYQMKFIKSQKKAPVNLEKVLPLLKDELGTVYLDIPVQGELNNPDVEFLKIFFDLFINIMNKAVDVIAHDEEKITTDKDYQIVYFNPGQSIPLINRNSLLNQEFIERLEKKNIYLVLSGFVDKKLDEPILKNAKYSTLVSEYKENFPDLSDIEILKTIYQNLAKISWLESDSDNQAEIKKAILLMLRITNQDFQFLALQRAKAIKDYLVEHEKLQPSRFFIKQDNIYENPYMSGISNTIGIMLTAEKK
ncbi:MAG: DUF748 domain-containing protein [Spirochaetes bacterium]|nr:DUF748 domain-containing protein [Spirochaetota bacterium]